MSWLKKADQNHRFEKQSFNRFLQCPFLKESQSKPLISEESISVSDVDRYRTDRYECYVSLMRTEASYDVGFQINNSQLGVASNVEYWHYRLNEFNQAKSTYQKIVKLSHDIINEFGREKIPFTLFGPRFRSAMKNIDTDHKDISGIYHVNQNIKNPSEGDWRETIYGPRYPRTPVIGNLIDGFFAEQSKYTIHEQENKMIETSGKGRKQQTNYRRKSD